MAAIIEPITTGLSLFNESFTAAQTVAALIGAPEEIQRAVRLISSVQAEITNAKALRDRVFDVTKPETARDEDFREIQEAIRNLDDLISSSARSLHATPAGSSPKPKDKRAKRPKTSVKKRFSWVTGGQSQHDANLQELQVHYQRFVAAKTLLQNRSREQPQGSPSLPFGDFEVMTSESPKIGYNQSPTSSNQLLLLPTSSTGNIPVSPRRSMERLLSEQEESDLERLNTSQSSDGAQVGSQQVATPPTSPTPERPEVLIWSVEEPSTVEDAFFERKRKRRRRDSSC
ncbi:hypothetical protein QBC40DRAFT_35948 [Triangularia verruculosa]|uniref:Fungal N-terminal domain-containing protein n=1 Tax=Triangularia verruculosa TaxID=2587418 RepID=A0AAN6XRU8_9PEZI|nr:hypothetical protein QBC40DRAFT_35948 [Triangularia verruculosa]